MPKKPALKSATPNDAESNALFDDAGHDLLTKNFEDPSIANRILIVGVGQTVMAGGHDDQGNRVTQWKLSHIEVAVSEADEKKVVDLLTSIHKRRTQSPTVAALQDPVEDEPLPGMAAGDDLPDVE
jgi:hypothetical protein